MVTQEQGIKALVGVTVYDAMVISQMIEKLLRGGLVTGKELGHVSSLRSKLHGLVKQTIGVDLDNLVPEKKDERE